MRYCFELQTNDHGRIKGREHYIEAEVEIDYDFDGPCGFEVESAEIVMVKGGFYVSTGPRDRDYKRRELKPSALKVIADYITNNHREYDHLLNEHAQLIQALWERAHGY